LNLSPWLSFELFIHNWQVYASRGACQHSCHLQNVAVLVTLFVSFAFWTAVLLHRFVV